MILPTVSGDCLTGGVQAGVVLWEALPGQAAHEWGQAREQGGGEGEGGRGQRLVECSAVPPTRIGPNPGLPHRLRPHGAPTGTPLHIDPPHKQLTKQTKSADFALVQQLS
jgi:hypothetical protein